MENNLRISEQSPIFPYYLTTPDLLISMHQDNSEIGRLQFSAANDGDVVSLADVVDVDGDAGIRSNAVLFHQSYQLGLSQVVRWTCMFLYHLNLTTCNIDTPLKERSKYAKLHSHKCSFHEDPLFSKLNMMNSNDFQKSKINLFVTTTCKYMYNIA